MRPWLWAGMVGMHVGIMGLIDFVDLSAAMIVAHLFAFDPAWLHGRAGDSRKRATSASAGASTIDSRNRAQGTRAGGSNARN